MNQEYRPLLGSGSGDAPRGGRVRVPRSARRQRESQGHAKEVEVHGGVIRAHWLRRASRNLATLATSAKQFPGRITLLSSFLGVGVDERRNLSGQSGEVKRRGGKRAGEGNTRKQENRFLLSANEDKFTYMRRAQARMRNK